MLCEYIHRRRVVGAVACVQRLHLGHEVEEEPAHPLLTLWKPEEKMKEKDVEHFARLHNGARSAALPSLQHGCNTSVPTLDVPTIAKKQCCSMRRGTYLVHSSRDWTSICWKVQISSRFPRIRATSEPLSLKHTLIQFSNSQSGGSIRDSFGEVHFVLVGALESSQVICQEALKIP